MARLTNIERHAIKRAKQRYQATAAIVDSVRRAIKRAIRETSKKGPRGAERIFHGAVRMQAEGPNRSRWRVTLGDQTYIVIYEEPTQTVVTFLPRDATP